MPLEGAAVGGKPSPGVRRGWGQRWAWRVLGGEEKLGGKVGVHSGRGERCVLGRWVLGRGELVPEEGTRGCSEGLGKWGWAGGCGVEASFGRGEAAAGSLLAGGEVAFGWGGDLRTAVGAPGVRRRGGREGKAPAARGGDECQLLAGRMSGKLLTRLWEGREWDGSRSWGSRGKKAIGE